MHIDDHYLDPRIVAVYDAENAGRADIDFYVALAAELSADAVIDIGCGTGVLAADLALAGHRVTGVDPAAAMLEVARTRSGGQLVMWIEGEAGALESSVADLAVMTGHVAQVFLTDDDWRAVLADLHRALRPGGHLAFETRNPAARAWESWNRNDSYAAFELPDGREVQSWVDLIGVQAGLVTLLGHNVFADTGADLVSSSTLRFRTLTEITTSLAGAGFETDALYGDWNRGPVSERGRELIVVATRR